jgi:hypothetical protein
VSRRSPGRGRALAAFSLSALVVLTGTLLAVRSYPGGYDWLYTVMSALASRKDNPGGAAWFAGGLALSLAVLWPVVAWIRERHGGERGLVRFGSRALQLGIVCGVLVGVERLTFLHFSDLVHKGHELLALVCFLSLYSGILAVLAHRVRERITSAWPAALTIAPLVAVGLSQLALYLDQRDLGWVDRSWREMGVPVWLSFAFWQWLAAAALWASLGYLVASARPERRAG